MFILPKLQVPLSLTILPLLPAMLAQSTTTTRTTAAAVIVIPTPMIWQDALSSCQSLGHSIYPVPTTSTDPVCDVLNHQAQERFWIRRRTGGSCTCLNKDTAGNMIQEAPCDDLLPVFCKG